MMNCIFGHFDPIQWCEANPREGYTPYLFVELNDHSKITLILAGDISQLENNFEKMTGSKTKFSYLLWILEKKIELCVISKTKNL